MSAINLDEKGRLAIPTRYRSELSDSCDGQLVVTVGLEKCLLLYPLPEFEEIERKLVKLPALNKKVKRLQRLLIGHATECEMDSQGRFLIPEPLRRFSALDEGVWNEARDQWIEEESTDEEELSPELGVLAF